MRTGTRPFIFDEKRTVKENEDAFKKLKGDAVEAARTFIVEIEQQIAKAATLDERRNLRGVRDAVRASLVTPVLARQRGDRTRDVMRSQGDFDRAKLIEQYRREQQALLNNISRFSLTRPDFGENTYLNSKDVRQREMRTQYQAYYRSVRKAEEEIIALRRTGSEAE